MFFMRFTRVAQHYCSVLSSVSRGFLQPINSKVNGHQRRISSRIASQWASYRQMMNFFLWKLQLLLLFHFQFIWFNTLNLFFHSATLGYHEKGRQKECLDWCIKKRDEEANGVKKFHWMVQMMRVITLIEFLNEDERTFLHIFIMMRKIHAFDAFFLYSSSSIRLQLCNKRKVGIRSQVSRWRRRRSKKNHS